MKCNRIRVGLLLGVLSIQSGCIAFQSCELSQRPLARGHSVIGKLPKFPLGAGGNNYQPSWWARGKL